MRVESGKIEGPFVLGHDLELRGMVTEHLTVRTGVVLILHGMVAGDLVVEAGATVNILGMVTGTVFNEGGNVTIAGTVGRLAGPYPCSVSPGAVVQS